MKKSFLTIASCVLLACSTMVALSACNGPSEKGEHTHTFDQKVTSNSKYRKTPASCTAPAVYYYSCACGLKGTETFEHGKPRGHIDQLTVSGNYKTIYFPGESFDTTGLEVSRECLNCGDSGTVSSYTVTPSGALTTDDTKVTITTETAEVNVDITVIKNVAVTNISLVELSGKVLYTVEGIYADSYANNLNNLRLELATVRDSFIYTEVNSSTLSSDATNKTFKLSVDVTNWAGNGRLLYPYLVADGERTAILDSTNKWNDVHVTTDTHEYIIIHKDTTDNAPALRKVYIGEAAGKINHEEIVANNHTKIIYGEDIYYQATGVEYKKSNDGTKALIVLKGTSKGFNFDQLDAVFDFSVGSGSLTYLYMTDGGLLTLDESTGDWELECNITNLPAGLTYFTRLANYDFDVLTVDQVTGEGESVTIGNKKFTFIYEPVNGEGNAGLSWGTIGFSIENVEL